MQSDDQEQTGSEHHSVAPEERTSHFCARNGNFSFAINRPLTGCGKTDPHMKLLSALCIQDRLLSFSSLPLAEETTEGEAGCEDFLGGLLAARLHKRDEKRLGGLACLS